MKAGFKKGQSMLEYALLLAAVIAIVIAVLIGKGGIQEKVKGSYTKIGNALETTTANLTNTVFR